MNITPEAVDALEKDASDRIAYIDSGRLNAPDARAKGETILALIAYWREQEALVKELETAPELCRHCHKPKEQHVHFVNSEHGYSLLYCSIHGLLTFNPIPYEPVGYLALRSTLHPKSPAFYVAH